VLSADLSGPHPEAVGTKFKYMLVAVFNGGPKTKNLPFVRGLTSKSSQEVVTGIKSVIAELNSIMGEQIVVRFHTDAGGEFLNEAMKSLLTTMEIHQTKTAGHDPKANGRAERYVGIIKQQATSYLMHSKLPLKFWYWAAKQAADLYRKRMMGVKLPVDAPTFGNRVLIRDPKAEEKSFVKKMNEAIFLCWDSTTVQGAFVLTQKDSGPTIVATSGPLPWPTKTQQETWRLESDPNSDNKIWISNLNRILWKAPDEKERITFEERGGPEVE